MRNFDHIIWDWNGTLVDDTQLCLDILNEQLQQKKMQPLDIETYRDRFDFPLETFYRKIGISDTHEDFLEINRAFLKEYTLRRGICRLYEGVVEVLETFKNSGGQHSVLSAYTVDALREMVRMLGVDRYFLHIMGIDRHEADSKVSEGLALVKALGCAPGRILFVGDTTHDYETARISGTACILIASGHQNRRQLQQCGVPVLDSHNQLPDFL